MPTGKPIPIPFPLSSFPGDNPQEGAGRLINCYAEPLGDGGKGAPAPQVWRRSPGLSLHAITPQTGYRGGLIVNNLSYECFKNNASTIDVAGNVVSLGNFPGTGYISIARNQAATPDVVAVDVGNGAYILNTAALLSAQVIATIAGSVFNAADTVALFFANTGVQGFPVLVTYTLGGAETATTIAAGLKALINANATLTAANVSATNVAGVLTIKQQGAIGNATNIQADITGTGNETVTFNPVSGNLAGGAGTPGINFLGAPLAYNGLGNLPAPIWVCFQDGYLFFGTTGNQVFATALNSLSLNALTYITAIAKADVQLLRGIAFSGLLLLFTTGSCEVWQDNANPAPAFPYARQAVLEKGLIQSAAIAGWETGFSELIWVAQDFGVYWMTAGSLAPIKISPPDLDRLIEAQVRAGNTLEAGCYAFAGKKFWHLSSPAWSWEFNLGTQKWNERWSLSAGVFGRWRATCGHPAFGKWLTGDQQSGNVLWIDSANYTENGTPQLARIESGPVKAFPQQLRIARADFDFVMGVGLVEGNLQMIVTGAVAGTGGVVRLTVNNTAQAATNDEVIVGGVTGTTEANGTWPITVIDGTHIELVGSVFKNAYISGGIAVDVTVPPSAVNPRVAVSCSKNGGLNFGNPLIRNLGVQSRSKFARASVKNMGLSGPMGDRWRLDVSDPVYTAFMGGTQSSDPREVGA